jgi:hypothetical protein
MAPHYLRRMALLLLPAVVFLAGCSSFENPLPDDGLVMELSLDRTEVESGGTFTATYSIRNTNLEPVLLTTACFAFARGVVYQNDQEKAFMGSSSGCYTSIGTYEIDAGETLTRQWEVEAAIIIKAYPDGRPPDIELAAPGHYVFRVQPDVFEINGAQAQLPSVEQAIEVR